MSDDVSNVSSTPVSEINVSSTPTSESLATLGNVKSEDSVTPVKSNFFENKPDDNLNEILPKQNLHNKSLTPPREVEKGESQVPKSSVESKTLVDSLPAPGLDSSTNEKMPGIQKDIETSYIRDPNDIEEEIQKITLAGYTQDFAHSVSKTSESVLNTSTDNYLPNDESLVSPKPAYTERQPAPVTLPSKVSIKAKPINTAAEAPIKSTVSTLRPVALLTAATMKVSQTKPPASATNQRLQSTPVAPKRPATTTADKLLPSLGFKANAKASLLQKMATSSSRASSVTRTPATRNSSDKSKSTLAPFPHNKKYENVTSKVQASSDYKPSGGNVKIFSQKVQIQVKSKIGSLQNVNHVPGGGQVKIENKKLKFKENAKPKIDAKSETKIVHVEKKIQTEKLQWKAEPKIGSLTNALHKPAGGDVKIFHQKVNTDGVTSKVGSLDNVDHKPAGGNVKICDYKVPLKPNSSVTSFASHSSTNSRRSSANASRVSSRKISHCKDPISPEQAGSMQ